MRMEMDFFSYQAPPNVATTVISITITIIIMQLQS